MRSLVTKEIRMLLPMLAVALVLAIVPVWFLPWNPDLTQLNIILFTFCFGVVLLSLTSFGREFSMGTFPLLLAQPMERGRIWWTKIAVLTGAVGLAFGAGLLSWQVKWWGLSANVPVRSLTLLATAVAFAGGLWTTLLLRQVTAAFWFTLLIPGAIVTPLLIKGWVAAACLALVIYAVAGFLLAWRQFSQAQETGWTGGVIALPSFLPAAAGTQAEGRSRRAVAALLWKELQLHQVWLLGMVGLFPLHLGLLALRKNDLTPVANTVRTISDLCSMLWFVVPLVAGCASVAEERKLGTWEAQLCLPVSSRMQLAVKLLFVIVLGGVLSAVLMWIRTGIGRKFGGIPDLAEIKIPFTATALMVVSFITTGIALVAFYASTLTRNIMQALGVAVVTAMLVWGAIFAANATDAYGLFFHILPWQGWLINIVGYPTLVVTFVLLAYSNLRRLSEPWRLWRRNLLGLAGGFLIAAAVTTGIYHRAWEFLTPMEPSHGWAKLSVEKAPMLRTGGRFNGLVVVLPDGRLWEDRLMASQGWEFRAFDQYVRIGLGVKWASLRGNHFFEGSNWVDAVADYRDTVGIQADGSLWVSEKPHARFRQRANEQPLTDKVDAMVKFGEETDWKSVVQGPGYPGIMLLKTDGTLWGWDALKWDWRKRWPGLGAFKPYRLGSDADWAEIVRVGGESFGGQGEAGTYAWKTDGEAWGVSGKNQTAFDDHPNELEPGKELLRKPGFDKIKWRSLTRFAPQWENFQAGVREDGTLWIWDAAAPKVSRLSPDLAERTSQVGTDTDWAEVASGDGRTLVALKSDGTLWKWQWDPDWLHPMGWPSTEHPARLGTHHDWVGIVDAMGGVISLAADGGVYYWWGGNFGYFWGGQLVAASRKPVKLGNIFGQEE